MKAFDLLRAILRANRTEVQGLLFSSSECTMEELLLFWFGDVEAYGAYRKDSWYLYSYDCELPCCEAELELEEKKLE